MCLFSAPPCVITIFRSMHHSFRSFLRTVNVRCLIRLILPQSVYEDPEKVNEGEWMVESLFILLPCGEIFHNIQLTSPSRLPCNLLRLITHTHPLPRCGGEVCQTSHARGRGRRGARGEWCDSPLLICRNIGLHNDGVETALGKPAGKPHEGEGKRREPGRERMRKREGAE